MYRFKWENWKVEQSEEMFEQNLNTDIQEGKKERRRELPSSLPDLSSV